MKKMDVYSIININNAKKYFLSIPHNDDFINSSNKTFKTVIDEIGIENFEVKKLKEEVPDYEADEIVKQLIKLYDSMTPNGYNEPYIQHQNTREVGCTLPFITGLIGLYTITLYQRVDFQSQDQSFFRLKIYTVVLALLVILNAVQIYKKRWYLNLLNIN